MNNQDALGDEQFVKLKYPDAEMYIDFGGGFVVGSLVKNLTIGCGKYTRHEAWADARRRIEEEPTRPVTASEVLIHLAESEPETAAVPAQVCVYCGDAIAKSDPKNDWFYHIEGPHKMQAYCYAGGEINKWFLAAPGKEFEEWWDKYLSNRSIAPFPDKASLWNAKQAAWAAWHAAPVEAKSTSSPLGRQDEHPSGYDNPLTMDRILQLAHVLCKCPPEYRSSWSCDPCRAFAELIFFRQSAATPVSVGGEDAPSDPGKYEGMNGSETWDRPDIDYPSPQKCGNNNHGLKARMTCVLPKGHTGNHEDSAKCWWRNS